jgi:hypothetical protein
LTLISKNEQWTVFTISAARTPGAVVNTLPHGEERATIVAHGT